MKQESDHGLIETMRCEGAIPLLDRHMARLAGSAAHFGIPLEERDLRQRVAEQCRRLDSRSPWRIRLLVQSSGDTSIAVSPISPIKGRLDVAISATRLDSNLEHLYHKTTIRDLYDTEWRAAQERGLFELIYLNMEEMVCEGSRTNIFIRTGSVWLTPPADAGLLPGVYRSLVLETFRGATERPLSLRDLLAADALYVCNAVVGLRRVHLSDSTAEFNTLT